MNPSTAFANRTARLVQEARTPRYTVESGKPTPHQAREARRRAEAQVERDRRIAAGECFCGDC